ncbi:hypothetical protein [Marinobacter shengliensis]|uniref:hypothetical protein n=1 Tax=Marinobacter shengliensis TaxID=1389223 RepID=UPI001E3BB439|nr:hypothetical protein [Marinobacter shengliensis]MCD1628492.1 hypothetical protein [Marinobacter shengliensis]
MARTKEGFGPPKATTENIVYLSLHNNHVHHIHELNTQLTAPFRFATMPSPFRPVTTLQVYTDTGWAHTLYQHLEAQDVPYSVVSGSNHPTDKRKKRFSKHMRIINSHDNRCVLAQMTPSEAEVYLLEHQYEEWCRLQTLKLICKE